MLNFMHVERERERVKKRLIVGVEGDEGLGTMKCKVEKFEVEKKVFSGEV